jgi:FtsZ-binding cell division protein ZapB
MENSQMDLKQLDDLEERINQAVWLIEKLRAENQELARTNQQLRSELQSRDMLFQRLQEENDHLRKQHNESTLGKEKEEKIRSKVEQMLARLDELSYNL